MNFKTKFPNKTSRDSGVGNICLKIAMVTLLTRVSSRDTFVYIRICQWNAPNCVTWYHVLARGAHRLSHNTLHWSGHTHAWGRSLWYRCTYNQKCNDVTARGGDAIHSYNIIKAIFYMFYVKIHASIIRPFGPAYVKLWNSYSFTAIFTFITPGIFHLGWVESTIGSSMYNGYTV